MNSHWKWSFGLIVEYQASINFKASGRKVKNFSQFQTTPSHIPTQQHAHTHTHSSSSILPRSLLEEWAEPSSVGSQIYSSPAPYAALQQGSAAPCRLHSLNSQLYMAWAKRQFVMRLESRRKGKAWAILPEAASPSWLSMTGKASCLSKYHCMAPILGSHKNHIVIHKHIKSTDCTS